VNSSDPHDVRVPAPRAGRVRLALTLNLFLPGAGLIYLGRRFLGALFAAGFIGCFFAMMFLFLRGYREYLRLSTGDILAGETLEAVGRAFPAGLLVGLLLLALVIYVASILCVAFGNSADGISKGVRS
jgi:hypothetical protein